MAIVHVQISQAVEVAHRETLTVSAVAPRTRVRVTGKHKLRGFVHCYSTIEEHAIKSIYIDVHVAKKHMA